MNTFGNFLGKLFIALAFVLAAVAFVSANSIESPISKQPGKLLSQNDRDNFGKGSSFVRTMYYAKNIDNKADSEKMAIVELVRLIDVMENEPEAVKLQAILKAIIRDSINGKTAGTDIYNLMNSYQSRQNSQTKWYFNSGVAITNLFISTYFTDAESTKKNLSEVQMLFKIAPQDIPSEILEQVAAMSKYFPQNTFNEADFASIYNQAQKVVSAVNT